MHVMCLQNSSVPEATPDYELKRGALGLQAQQGLQTRIAELEAAVERGQHDLQQSTDRIGQLAQQLASASEEAAQAEAQSRSMEQQLIDALAARDESEEKQVALVEELETVKRTLADAQASAGNADAVQQQLQDAQAAQAAAESSAQAVQQDLANLQQKLAQTEAELAAERESAT